MANKKVWSYLADVLRLIAALFAGWGGSQL